VGGPGGITQAIPEDAAARTSAPILPPMAPPQPNWKDKAEGDHKPDPTTGDAGKDGGKE